MIVNRADIVLAYEVSQDFEGNTVPVCHGSNDSGPIHTRAPLFPVVTTTTFWRSTRKLVVGLSNKGRVSCLFCECFCFWLIPFFGTIGTSHCASLTSVPLLALCFRFCQAARTCLEVRIQDNEMPCGIEFIVFVSDYCVCDSWSTVDPTLCLLSLRAPCIWASPVDLV